MESSANKTMQNDSPAGEFLQSEGWRNFQESVGRKTFNFSGENFWANIVEHTLPIVGKYFYVPRGPLMKISNFQFPISNQIQSSNDEISKGMGELFDLAKNNNAGWIRIEPETEEILEKIKKVVGVDLVSAQDGQAQKGQTQGLSLRKYKIQKAPHDVQPRETFVIDIAKSEEELLAEMKPKTRYNIRLAEKKGVEVFLCCHPELVSGSQEMLDRVRHDIQFYIDEFVRLTAVMAKRQGITAHPENYYRKMLEIIPGDNLKLYVAEYDGPASTRPPRLGEAGGDDGESTRGGKIIAANLVVFYGETCIYLHGASDDNFRNIMAPYLLQWRQICDAKKAGCKRYDFGGVASAISNFQFPISNQIPNPNDKNIKQTIQNTKWQGITKFKLGFSPKTLPTVFPGSYDIVIDPVKYLFYRFIQKVKIFLR